MKYVKGRRSYSMTINNNTTGTIPEGRGVKLGYCVCESKIALYEPNDARYSSMELELLTLN